MNESAMKFMEERRELEFIRLRLDHFFLIFVGLWGMVFFIGWIFNYFTNCFKDSIIKLCVSGGLQNIAATVLLFQLYRFQKWPSMNPLKMHPLDCLVIGVRGLVQLLPLSYVTGALWQKIVSSLKYVLNVDCVEQPLLALLRSKLTHGRQFYGIVFLIMVLAPVTEEMFFRYFLYRSWKSYMPSRQAMLLTAFVFALLHFNLAAFLSLWVMGIFLTFLYERCGNLLPCIIVHGLFNYVSVLLVILFS
ncbi:MAG: CPBP family intramembrane metalloprotease [Puniceicoccales bacterium]|jgi:membrane protease YdiL (CAAX protease family)|nr:CPBP family intramembrane metalloprotease [Puniceicoccales bacterium]